MSPMVPPLSTPVNHFNYFQTLSVYLNPLTYRLDNHYNQLEKEYKEEQHKVGARVILEGFVCRSIPARSYIKLIKHT